MNNISNFDGADDVSLNLHTNEVQNNNNNDINQLITHNNNNIILTANQNASQLISQNNDVINKYIDQNNTNIITTMNNNINQLIAENNAGIIENINNNNRILTVQGLNNIETKIIANNNSHNEKILQAINDIKLKEVDTDTNMTKVDDDENEMKNNIENIQAAILNNNIGLHNLLENTEKTDKKINSIDNELKDVKTKIDGLNNFSNIESLKKEIEDKINLIKQYQDDIMSEIKKIKEKLSSINSTNSDSLLNTIQEKESHIKSLQQELNNLRNGISSPSISPEEFRSNIKKQSEILNQIKTQIDSLKNQDKIIESIVELLEKTDKELDKINGKVDKISIKPVEDLLNKFQEDIIKKIAESLKGKELSDSDKDFINSKLEKYAKEIQGTIIAYDNGIDDESSIKNILKELKEKQDDLMKTIENISSTSIPSTSIPSTSPLLTKNNIKLYWFLFKPFVNLFFGDNPSKAYKFYEEKEEDYNMTLKEFVSRRLDEPSRKNFEDDFDKRYGGLVISKDGILKRFRKSTDKEPLKNILVPSYFFVNIEITKDIENKSVISLYHFAIYLYYSKKQKPISSVFEKINAFSVDDTYFTTENEPNRQGEDKYVCHPSKKDLKFAFYYNAAQKEFFIFNEDDISNLSKLNMKNTKKMSKIIVSTSMDTLQFAVPFNELFIEMFMIHPLLCYLILCGYISSTSSYEKFMDKKKYKNLIQYFADQRIEERIVLFHLFLIKNYRRMIDDKPTMLSNLIERKKFFEKK